MPRLSIVVPFKKNAARLESTLLSILENRPHDSEVILVHDGNYDDPYSLGQDELLVVDSGGSSSLIALVNEGVRAACAPIVHILFPGMEVESGWVDSALDAFQANDVGAVSLGRARDWKCEGDRAWAKSAMASTSIDMQRNEQGAGVSMDCGWSLPKKSPLGAGRLLGAR